MNPEGNRLDLWFSETPKVSAWELCPVFASGSEPMPSTSGRDQPRSTSPADGPLDFNDSTKKWTKQGKHTETRTLPAP